MKFLLAIFVLTFFTVSNASASQIDGLWLTENKRAVIAISACENGDPICGKIHWIIDGGMQVDEKNENPEFQNQPLCGLQILYGFKQNNANNEWNDGKIYKADDGDLYNANIKQINADTLRLRGYVGIPLFGKTQIWKRVKLVDYKSCG